MTDNNYFYVIQIGGSSISIRDTLEEIRETFGIAIGSLREDVRVLRISVSPHNIEEINILDLEDPNPNNNNDVGC